MPESVKDVEIIKVGNKRIVLPVGQSWEDWFNTSGVSGDFMVSREQPEDQIREISKFNCRDRNTMA